MFYRIKYKLQDYWQEVVFAWQRVFRGFDDTWYWGYDTANAVQTLKVLRWLKEHKHGAPYTNDPDGVLSVQSIPDVTRLGYCDGGPDSNWFERWDEALGIMIDGFQAFLDADEVFLTDADGNYDHKKSMKERNRLWAIWEKGSKLFIANYAGLWD